MASRGWVIAGLGNPGARYVETRHNAGFLLLDALIAEHAPQARWRTQFKGETASLDFAEQQVLLIKPQTFMNLSGESVQECLAFNKIDPAHLVVVHDEIDIPFGQLRIKKGGGSGGHNGIKSIHEMLSTPDFYRVRVGVGRPGLTPDGKPVDRDVSSHVLSSFSREEKALIAPFFGRCLAALETLLKSGIGEAQRLFH